MAKISVDISANVTGTDGVNEFAQSMQDAQKSVSEFTQSQAASSLQGVADALKEFATNALKASEAFGAMGRVQVPQAPQGTQQAIPSSTLPQAQAASSAPTQGQSATSAQNDAAALFSQAKATIKDSTRTLEDRLEWLTDAIDKARDKLDEAVEAQDSLATQSWGDTTAELEMQRDRLKAEQAAQDRKDAATSTGVGGGADKLASYFLSQGIGQAAGLVFQGLNIGSSYRMDMANGNYLGAGVNAERGVGSIVSTASQVVGGIMSMFLPAWAGAIVSGVGSVVGGGLNADANRREADIAEGQRYQQLFAPKYGTARLYGGAIGNTKYGGILSKSDHKDENGDDVWEATSVEDNATWSNELINRAEVQARGTGLSITDFMNASQTYAAAGVTSADQAFKLTRDAANWTKSTGANMDSLMRLQSLGAQYGLGDNVIRTAYGGLKASGMERGQFDEFLSGLQQVIENGIANGFVKSAEDVASELSLFARLSGNNPLWQGQNGVNTLMQLNQGLAGATAMQTPEQVAAVSAAKDVLERYKAGLRESGLSEEEINSKVSEHFGITATGGWTDYMQLLEAGNGEVLWDTLRGIRERNGDNTDAGITEITKLFHIDNKKAADIWQMILKGGGLEWSQLSSSQQSKIKAMGGIRLEEETEQTQWQDALNGIEQAMNEYTKTQFTAALTQLEKIEANTRKEAAKANAQQAKEGLPNTAPAVASKTPVPMGAAEAKEYNVMQGLANPAAALMEAAGVKTGLLGNSTLLEDKLRSLGIKNKEAITWVDRLIGKDNQGNFVDNSEFIKEMRSLMFDRAARKYSLGNLEGAEGTDVTAEEILAFAGALADQGSLETGKTNFTAGDNIEDLKSTITAGFENLSNTIATAIEKGSYITIEAPGAL